VRHKLVQQIVKAYDAYSNRGGQPAAASEPSNGRGAQPS
jgi:hypothetical protein